MASRHYETFGDVVYVSGTLLLAVFFAADVATVCWVLSSGTVQSASACYVSNLLTAVLYIGKEVLSLVQSHATMFSLGVAAFLITSKVLTTYAIFLIAQRLRHGILRLADNAGRDEPMLADNQQQPVMGTPVAVGLASPAPAARARPEEC
eukprot:6183745-Pleurochrysis_carterae.AAC.2